MSPTMLLRIVVMLPRFVFVLIAMLAILGLCAVAIWVLRRTGLSKPQPRPHIPGQAPRLVVWLVIAWPLGLGVMMYGCRDSLRPLGWVILVLLYLMLVAGVPVLAITVKTLVSLDWVLLRLVQRGDGGDLAGAIAGLQVILDRQLARAAPVTSDNPAGPWTPPREAIRRDSRLAGRLKQMGVFQGSRGDWPAALAYHQRAEATGGPTPIFRSNIGLVRVKLGEEAEGLAAMRGALAESAEGPPMHRYELALSLSRVLVDLERWDEARVRLDEATRAMKVANAFPPSMFNRLGDPIGKVRALLPSPETVPGAAGLDAGGDRG